MIKIISSVFFIFNCLAHNLKANEDNLYKWTTVDYEESIEFTTQVVLGILFHEIGHLVIDEFNVPIFNNEEDVADSFMAWHLIHIPSDYDSYQDYEIYSKEPHRIIKAISDFNYYKTLLGYNSENEFNNHSTDKKRFFNIACFMKGANPEVFDSYFVKRSLINQTKDKNFIETLDELCNYNYEKMYEAWWNIFKNYWIMDLDNYKQKISLNFEKTDNEFFNDFRSVAEEKINLHFNKIQIHLSENYTTDFLSCKVKFPKESPVNAYYSRRYNQIIFCYELVDHIMQIKYNIILLKNSL